MGACQGEGERAEGNEKGPNTHLRWHLHPMNKHELGAREGA